MSIYETLSITGRFDHDDYVDDVDDVNVQRVLL